MNQWRLLSFELPALDALPQVLDWNHQPFTVEGPLEALDMYVHLPFCEKACVFCGLNINLTMDHGWEERYLDLLQKELALKVSAFQIAHGAQISTLWLGGGTPNFFSSAALSGWLEVLKKHFDLTKTKLQIEIDPRLSPEGWQDFNWAGPLHLQSGVQSFAPSILKKIERPYDLSLLSRWKKTFSRSGSQPTWGVDLLMGVQGEADRMAFEMKGISELNPSRINLYSLKASKSSERSTQWIEKDQSAKLKVLSEMFHGLLHLNYKNLGFGVWEKASQKGESDFRFFLQRQFSGFSLSAETLPLMGLGVGAISLFEDGYQQNEKALAIYQRAVERGEFKKIASRTHRLEGYEKNMAMKLKVPPEFFSVERAEMAPFLHLEKWLEALVESELILPTATGFAARSPEGGQWLRATLDQGICRRIPGFPFEGWLL